MNAAKDSVYSVLYTLVDTGLKLLHPVMPFLTEELYHRMPGHAERVAVAKKVLIYSRPTKQSRTNKHEKQQQKRTNEF